MIDFAVLGILGVTKIEFTVPCEPDDTASWEGTYDLDSIAELSAGSSGKVCTIRSSSSKRMSTCDDSNSNRLALLEGPSPMGVDVCSGGALNVFTSTLSSSDELVLLVALVCWV